jgi:hypothetical protein
MKNTAHLFGNDGAKVKQAAAAPQEVKREARAFEREIRLRTERFGVKHEK